MAIATNRDGIVSGRVCTYPLPTFTRISIGFDLAAPEATSTRVIRCHVSQLRFAQDASGRFHPACGYLCASVKRHEFLWPYPFVGDVDTRTS